jgi:hypothetical protein
MAGLFKAFGSVLDTVVTLAEVVNTTASAGLVLAQGAEASAVQYRDTQVLSVMDELGLSSGEAKADLALWRSLRQEERDLLLTEQKKVKVKTTVVAP